jgi:hypothetical protein
VRIVDGQPEQHVTPLALNPQPGVAPPTPRFPGASGPADAESQVSGVRDLTGERLSQLAASEAEFAAAQALAQSVDGGRRGRLEADMAPLGASYGDLMPLPPVPEGATAPAASFLYPEQGDLPTIAGGPFGGNEPGY